MSNMRGNASLRIRQRVHKVNKTKPVRLSLVSGPRFSRERDYRHTARIAAMMGFGKRYDHVTADQYRQAQRRKP